MLVSETPFSVVASANRADGERCVESKNEDKQKIQENALDGCVIDAIVNMGCVLQIASVIVDVRRACKARR